MNDEFEQRLARHSLRAPPAEVSAELIAALRAQRADPSARASAPWTPRASGDSSSSGAVWRTLGLLWAGALAMLCWSNSGLDTPAGASIQPTPEQMAAIRAEQAALWELATFQEPQSEPPSLQVPPQRPLEPKDRSRTQRPRSQLQTPSLPMLGNWNPPSIPASPCAVQARPPQALNPFRLTLTDTPCPPHPHALPA